MSEQMERAHETMHHGHPAHSDAQARRVAVLVSVLAAALALAEVGEKAAQNEYLTHHIAVSDTWAFYQAKNLRAVVRDSEAAVLSSLPADPKVTERVTQAQAYSARMRDDPKGGEGMKQLADKAHAQEHTRDEAFHRYHNYEYTVGALQIAIVLASVSVVTRIGVLALGAAGIGAAACAYGLAAAAHLI